MKETPAKPGSGIGICIIVENMPVPPDTRVWREATTLSDAGYRVSVICPKGRGFEKSFEILDGIEIYRHSMTEASGLLAHVAEYFWALLIEFYLALKIFRRTRFRVIQACNPPDTIFLIALFFKIFGVRFIFDQHDPVPEFFEARSRRRGIVYWLLRLIERATFKTADVAIVTNESCREIAMTRGGVSQGRVFVVRTCPRLSDFAPRLPRTDLRAGRAHLVAYVGVMGSQDGLDLLLDSIHCLVKERGRTDTQFALIGAGTELTRLKSRVLDSGLDPWVDFTGALYGEELRNYLATASIGVAPDPRNVFNDKLTMIKILEYMACSLPIVLFDLTEGRRSAEGAALFATRNDPIDFADQLEVLLNCEKLRRSLGATGRRRVEESLHWERERQTLLHAYATALQ
jgi:glycosyltransferase involved in cell wall biosynthesis